MSHKGMLSVSMSGETYDLGSNGFLVELNSTSGFQCKND